MSCDQRRAAFLAHATVSGPGSAAAHAFGGADAAQAILTDVFDIAQNQPVPIAQPQLRLNEVHTRALFARFRACGIDIPTHAASGLPTVAAQQGYAALWKTLQAVEQGQPVPALTQQLLDARRVEAAPTSAPVDATEALQLAAATRTDTGAVDSTARDRLMARLPASDVAGNITAATLRPFAAHAFGRNGDDLQLAQPEGAGLHGVSGDAVFLVRDQTNAVIGAVKAFKNRDTFTSELSALHRLAAADAQGIGAPTVHLAATTQQDTIPYALLAMSTAPGRGVDKYMQIQGLQGPARQAALAQLAHMIGAAASLLARLHTQIAGSGGTPAAAQIGPFCTSLQNITDKLVQHDNTLRLGILDRTGLQQRSAELIAAVRRDPGPTALAHNDAHPGNIFYDTQRGATLIDLASMHRSMDAQGNPVGLAARGVAYFAHKVAYFGPGWGFTTEEIGHLQGAFRRDYAAAGGAAIPTTADTFFQLRTATGELIELSNRIGPQPSPDGLDRLTLQTDLVNRILQST